MQYRGLPRSMRKTWCLANDTKFNSGIETFVCSRKVVVEALIFRLFCTLPVPQWLRFRC